MLGVQDTHRFSGKNETVESLRQYYWKDMILKVIINDNHALPRILNVISSFAAIWLEDLFGGVRNPFRRNGIVPPEGLDRGGDRTEQRC